MTQDPTPQEALASIQAARTGIAPPTDYPIGYDLIYGLICALLVAGQGLAQPWSLIVLVFAMAGLGGLVQWWRKRFGWWVSGYSPRRARWVAIPLAVLFVGLVGVSFWGREQGLAWISLVTGPIAFVLAIGGGRLWMHVWRKELAEGMR